MPLLWVSLAFLAGIVLASLASLPWWLWAALGLAFLALSFPEKRLTRPNWLPAFQRFSRVTLGLLLAALFAGAARYQAHIPAFTPTDLAYYNGSEVTLTGVIAAPPDRRDSNMRLRVRAQQIRPDGAGGFQPVDGFVLVQVAAGKDWRYGDRIKLEGKLTTPAEHEDFSYKQYLAVRGVHSTLYFPYSRLLERGQGKPLLSAIYALRQRAYAVIERLYPQPEAGLLAGILLGIESDIPADLDQAFRDTGTTHIIAISGFNIAILSTLFFGLSRRLVAPLLSRWWALLLAAAAIAAYTVLVGAQASVVRAAIMGSMALLGRQIGRRNTGAISLAFTAAVMSALNPLLPWDVGFQLSFMATLGLVLYAEPLQTRFEAWLGRQSLRGRRLSPQFVRQAAGPVSEYFLFTLAAQLTTLPVIVYHFGRFSLSSFLANVLILPPQPLVMQLGGVSLLAGLVWLPLGQALAWVVWPLPAYTNAMVRWLAEIPGGAYTLGRVPLAAVLAFYALLFALTLGLPVLRRAGRLGGLLRQVQPAAILVALTLVSVGVWRGAAAAPDGRMHASILNMPDGPALLVQTPGGQTLLVGGGSSASRLSSELGQRLPLGRRRLDALLVTARKSTALEGLPLTVERFPARLALWNPDAAGLRNGERLAEILARQGVSPGWLESGQVLNLGGGASLRVLLHNFQGTALLLEWQNFSLLLPGGVPPQTLLRAFASDLAGVDVLVLGEADLAEDPAGWVDLPAALLVWQGPGGEALPAAPRGLHLDGYRWLELETNGQQLWASTGK